MLAPGVPSDDWHALGVGAGDVRVSACYFLGDGGALPESDESDGGGAAPNMLVGVVVRARGLQTRGLPPDAYASVRCGRHKARGPATRGRAPPGANIDHSSGGWFAKPCSLGRIAIVSACLGERALSGRPTTTILNGSR